MSASKRAARDRHCSRTLVLIARATACRGFGSPPAGRLVFAGGHPPPSHQYGAQRRGHDGRISPYYDPLNC